MLVHYFGEGLWGGCTAVVLEDIMQNDNAPPARTNE